MQGYIDFDLSGILIIVRVLQVMSTNWVVLLLVGSQLQQTVALSTIEAYIA